MEPLMTADTCSVQPRAFTRAALAATAVLSVVASGALVPVAALAQTAEREATPAPTTGSQTATAPTTEPEAVARRPSPEVAAMLVADPMQAQELAACLSKAQSNPDEAFEDAMVWRSRSGGVDAGHCAAVALVERGQVEAGARLLSGLAGAPMAGSADHRAMLLSKSANAWMTVDGLSEALAALTTALEIVPDRADLLAERAQVYALAGRWGDAQADLDASIAARPDAFAFRLRAESLMQLGSYDAADADVAAALALEPSSIETRLVRGRIREARRLGRPPS
jgi:tetratricopeptide (TPR) repeat protein